MTTHVNTRVNTRVNTQGYSIDRPAGWYLQQTPDLTANKLFMVGPKIGPFNAGVTITSLTADAEQAVHVIGKAAREQRQLPRFALLEEKDVSGERYRAWYVSTRWFHDSANVVMYTQQVFCHYQGQLYIIVSSAPNCNLNADVRDIMNDTINSFRLH